jgi:HD-GYP domain-containing protein (c-di-GMP phosphodiesterase class II)
MSDNGDIFLASSYHLTKVIVKDLRIGMYVSKLDRPWLETNFLFQGFELQATADIKAIQEQCKFVYVDATKQNKMKKVVSRNTAYSKGWLESRKPPEKKESFEKEIENAGFVHEHTSTLVRSFMEEVRLGRGINIELSKKAVADCVNSIIINPDALMFMTQLKNRDEYTAQHSMNVCIYSIALGRQINLPVSELNNLGLCGMLHDMGKMRIPLAVLNKPSELTDDELKVMKSHATLGWKLLLNTNGVYGGAIDVAYTHHEKLDGTGYPRGLKDEQISPYARIVAIADMYDAITSDRVYKKSKTHLEAINIMTNNIGDKLDSGLVFKFIECLGVYPPGNIVEMTNGEVAVVIEVNEERKLKPKITMLLDEDKKRVKPRLVDLAKIDLDSCGRSYAVKRMVKYDEFDINMNELYEMDLVRKSLAPH